MGTGKCTGAQDHPVLLPLEPPHVVNIFLCVMCMPGVHLRERRERSEEEGKEEERVGGLELSFHHVGSWGLRSSGLVASLLAETSCQPNYYCLKLCNLNLLIVFLPHENKVQNYFLKSSSFIPFP